MWGHGYASETTRALAGSAFRHDVDEIFAWSGRGTSVPQRPSAAMAWNGSGRPASISVCLCRCSGHAAPTSTPRPRRHRYRRNHHRATDPNDWPEPEAANDSIYDSSATRRGVVHNYMYSLGPAIAGGASNIQRNIIGERGLGLPRDLRAS